MNILCIEKDYSKIKKAHKKCAFKDSVTLTEVDAEISCIKITTDKGGIVTWTSGIKNIESFLRKGYVFDRKRCPYRLFKRCSGQKCQLFHIENNCGDCSLKWQLFKK